MWESGAQGGKKLDVFRDQRGQQGQSLVGDGVSLNLILSTVECCEF